MLKQVMAKALMAFCPLDARLGVGGHRRAEIDCTSQGTLFVVSPADLTVENFSSIKPSPELRRLVVPSVLDSPSIMCAIQMTLLKRGVVYDADCRWGSR